MNRWPHFCVSKAFRARLATLGVIRAEDRYWTTTVAQLLPKCTARYAHQTDVCVSESGVAPDIKVIAAEWWVRGAVTIIIY